MRPALKHPIPAELRRALATLSPQHREAVELICGLRPDGKFWTLRAVAALPTQRGHCHQAVAQRRDRAFDSLWALGFLAVQHGYAHGPTTWATPGYDIVEREY